jgi:hypothetical protein
VNHKPIAKLLCGCVFTKYTLPSSVHQGATRSRTLAENTIQLVAATGRGAARSPVSMSSFLRRTQRRVQAGGRQDVGISSARGGSPVVAAAARRLALDRRVIRQLHLETFLKKGADRRTGATV